MVRTILLQATPQVIGTRRTQMTDQVIIYHANCIDGSVGALCAYYDFPKAYFHAATHNKDDDILDKVKDKDVYFIDFCYKEDKTRAVCELAKSVVFLDHHQTSLPYIEKIVDENTKCKSFCSMDKSGAMLAYEYFSAAKECYINAEIVELVQDRDLWKWEYPETEAVTSFLYTLPQFDPEVSQSFVDWHLYCTEYSTEELTKLGNPIVKARQKNIEDGCKRAFKARMFDREIYIANATDCFSEIAGELALKGEFGATFHINSQGKYVYSLRVANGDLDISVLAETVGGGGHKKAAGCTSELPLHQMIKT
jgi:oligoribonuclease NrnB/cAMP/cGMP phosphodiesterase (DHH superfamily)